MPQVGNTSLFRLKVEGVISTVNTLNIFWYWANVVPNTVLAGAVIDAFDLQVRANWANMVADDWTAANYVCDEVTSISNFAEGGNSFSGAQVGENMPPYECFDFIFRRTTKETRSGRKRICGMIEPQQSGGFVTVGTTALMNALASDFQTTLTPAGGSCLPVIVRQTFTPGGDPQAPSLWIYNLVSSVDAIAQVTTQSTRKYGRGI